jgi:hypothetical protein
LQVLLKGCGLGHARCRQEKRNDCGAPDKFRWQAVPGRMLTLHGVISYFLLFAFFLPRSAPRDAGAFVAARMTLSCAEDRAVLLLCNQEK